VILNALKQLHIQKGLESKFKRHDTRNKKDTVHPRVPTRERNKTIKADPNFNLQHKKKQSFQPIY